ncbi:hypothetical protein DR950_36035 [Kitasatospora xanthocidica]|uniref:BRCT domain-containing protein n=1 Tax=Kitasatospora xanthocidica TaxID=83382 RepID=A0A373A4F0_9ACTN|nr:hypothetical protein [Kitasatospora xanthocidica]RGD62447.1 hypothetical protein DR950_36035 [Kitasatospora xanthocidica]
MAIRKIVRTEFVATCDAHAQKGVDDIPGTCKVFIGARGWDLCQEHEDKFVGFFVEALGEPCRTEVHAVEAPEEETAAEPEEDVQEGAEEPAQEEPKQLSTGGFDAAGQGLWDDFPEDLPEDDEDFKGTVVVTGNIPGYNHSDARRALENAGYTVAGHVDADTVMIVLGKQPAAHKVAEARHHQTPALDASRARVFANCVEAGEFPANDELPDVELKRGARALLPV